MDPTVLLHEDLKSLIAVAESPDEKVFTRPG